MQAPPDSLTVHFLERGPRHTPRIGLGLAALGRPGYINLGHGGDLINDGSSPSKDVDSMRQHCWEMLDEAWRLGVRYFDAARSYGRAEEFLGGWLQARGIPPAEVVIGSKWGWVQCFGACWFACCQHRLHEFRVPRLSATCIMPIPCQACCLTHWLIELTAAHLISMVTAQPTRHWLSKPGPSPAGLRFQRPEHLSRLAYLPA